jgi:hypothetical protein
MSERKDVLALCARFQEFLVPLDIHVLRQRDNGLIFQSTYVVQPSSGHPLHPWGVKPTLRCHE